MYQRGDSFRQRAGSFGESHLWYFAYPRVSKGSIDLASSLRVPRFAMRPLPDPERHEANGQSSKRWLIVVARGQADLYAHLVQAFSRDGKVRVILDRRKDDSRNSPQVTHWLRTHGAVIIRQVP